MSSVDKNLFDYKRMVSLYANAKLIVPMVIVQSALYLFLSKGHAHYDALFIWWAAYNIYTFVITGICTYIHIKMKREGFVEGRNYAVLDTFWAVFMSSGFAVLWGAHQTFIFPNDPLLVFLLLFLIIGTISATTIIHSISRKAVIMGVTLHFIFFTRASYVYGQKLAGDTDMGLWFGLGMGLMVLMTWGFSMKASRELYANQKENIDLVHERQEMVEQLEVVNEKVNQANSSLIEAQKQVEESARMATLGEVSASVAHEINNPLAVIKAASDSIELGLEMSGEGSSYAQDFELLNKNLQRVTGIVDSFKSLTENNSSEEAVEYDDIDISVAVSGITDSFQKRGANLKASIKEGLVLGVSKSHLEQVLVHLLNNAMDAVENLDDGSINVSLSDEKGFIELIVEDTGEGVPKDIRNKVFEPFFSTKGRKDGLGMGLSIASSLAKSMRARLYLEETSKSKFIIEFGPGITEMPESEKSAA